MHSFTNSAAFYNDPRYQDTRNLISRNQDIANNRIILFNTEGPKLSPIKDKDNSDVDSASFCSEDEENLNDTIDNTTDNSSDFDPPAPFKASDNYSDFDPPAPFKASDIVLSMDGEYEKIYNELKAKYEANEAKNKIKETTANVPGVYKRSRVKFEKLENNVIYMKCTATDSTYIFNYFQKNFIKDTVINDTLKDIVEYILTSRQFSQSEKNKKIAAFVENNFYIYYSRDQTYPQFSINIANMKSCIKKNKSFDTIVNKFLANDFRFFEDNKNKEISERYRKSAEFWYANYSKIPDTFSYKLYEFFKKEESDVISNNFKITEDDRNKVNFILNRKIEDDKTIKVVKAQIDIIEKYAVNDNV